jgi:hypothetical protein
LIEAMRVATAVVTGSTLRAARLWQTLPDAVPIGDSVCHLIEQAAGGHRS